ncbi:MAG: VCBS repeat-containing protein [Planctomycetaceae bacterium]
MTRRFPPVAALAATLVLNSVVAANEFPAFTPHVIDPHPGEIVYAVTHADVDGDGKQDVVAVTGDAVYWYAAPDWKKRVVIKDQTVRDNVCIAAHDIDGDGKIDFALGAGWPQKGGTIQWLSRNESLDENWNVHFIGEIPWTHRMHWGDVLGTGTPQLTVSPLNKTEGDGVKLTAFEIPENPKMDRWKATVLDDSLNRMHNHWHVEGAEGEPHRTLTASQEGIFLIGQGILINGVREKPFAKMKVADGAAGDKPTEKGAGEVKVGKPMMRSDPLPTIKALLAMIEPMHGNMVVAYVPQRTGPHARIVLDDTLGRGHALWIADLDADGDEEIVVGHSEPATGEIKGPGVYFYQAEDDTGAKWTKHVVDDGGMATEDLFVLDLTGDGKPDIVAGGRNTHNVKLYVNGGK